MNKIVQDHMSESFFSESEVAVPEYLKHTYWWTYIHPWAVKLFDHQLVVNCLLLTQYNRLRRETLKAAADKMSGEALLISCAYGDLIPKLADNIAKNNGTLDIIDVLPIQLRNARAKLPPDAPVRLINMNAANLDFPSEQYDLAVIFFLLHETPEDVRARVLEEAFRVLKPGGRLVLAEFAMPRWWNPFRYLWAVFLSIFEPYALDMWRTEIADMLPASARGYDLKQTRYFGRLFQRTVVTKS